MKKYPVVSLLALSVFAGAGLTTPVTLAQNVPQYMTSMDGRFDQNPRLSELLPVLVNGPKEADANGSFFETPTAHRSGPHEMAYQTWQEYCYRNSAPGMDSAIVKEQMKAVLAGSEATNEVKVWMMKQFQWIGTEEDLVVLIPFLTSPEYTLRDEAIRTISTIPSPKAVDVLKAAAEKADDADKQRIADAIAQRTQDLSVVIETAFPQALPYATDAQADAYLRDFAKFSTELKIQTLASLTVRGDRKYLPLALSVLNAEGEDAEFLVRAGLLALEKLATAAEAPALLDKLAFDRGLTIRIASVVEADGFDDALAKALDAADDPGKFSAIAEILTNRYVNIFQPVYERISMTDCPNRGELMRTICRIATKENVSALVDVLGLFNQGHDRDEAEKLIAAVCDGDSAPVLTKERDLALVLPLLGRIGDEAAWTIIDENLKNDSLRDVAVRALCNLPNARQAKKMLGVVDGSDVTEEQKIQALRAFIRVVSLPDDQIGIRVNSAQKLEMLRDAMKRAVRVEEKKLILSRLNAIRDVASAEFAMEFITDPALEQDACRAIVELAHHNNIRRPNANFFRSALDVVIEKCADSGLVTRARKYRETL